VSTVAPATPRRANVAAHPGPGDLTLTSIVLFTLGAYGVAAGAATGQDAVVAVGVFAFTLFGAGIVWPIVALARVRVEIVSPAEATVGDTIDLRITITGRAARVDVRVLDPPGPWLRTAAPARGHIPHVATRRGVFPIVRVQLRSSAPLGVFVRTRTVRVALARPVLIAPKPTREAPVLDPVPEERMAALSPRSAPGAGDTVRAVRPYVPGDPARMVHWPTSARRGELVVREHEPPPTLGVAIVLDLRCSDPELAASRAAGMGGSTLAAGGLVWCGAHAGGEPTGGLVGDPRELGRLLALATPGPVPEPPEGWTTRVVTA
jgi:uncharacterized protein (DUF58 family)